MMNPSSESTTGNFVLDIATRRVHRYADDLMRDHAQAMECRDCEEHLQQGIDAYKWLRRAEETLREADYEGILTFSKDLEMAIDTLYKAWLGPAEHAERWIKALRQKGYTPDNLNDFREICEDVKEIVGGREWGSKATKARASASAVEPW